MIKTEHECLKRFAKIEIIASLGVGIIVMVLLFGFIGQGVVRHTSIYLPEVIRTTVSFQNIDNQVKIVGVSGVGGINPTLISRTDYNYTLTIKNEDIFPHIFYVDGINVNSRVIQPGQNETMHVFSLSEGNYHYYDRFEPDIPLGEFRIVKVGLLNQYP